MLGQQVHTAHLSRPSRIRPYDIEMEMENEGPAGEREGSHHGQTSFSVGSFDFFSFVGACTVYWDG